MSRIILITIMVLVSLQFAKANESITHTLSVDYSGTTVKQESHSSGEVFCVLNIPSLQNHGEENQPLLPVKTLIFEVPINVNNFSATVDSFTLYGQRILPKPILPAEYISTGTSLEENAINQNVIYGSEYFNIPTTPQISILDDFMVDGYRHFVKVMVSPVVYNHQNLKVQCYTDISITLSYDTCTTEDLLFKPFELSEVSSIHDINDDVIAGRSSKIQYYQNSSKNSFLDTYVILTPSELADAWKNFAEWKRQLGYQVYIKNFEDIYSDSLFCINSSDKCFDDASCVREWLISFHSQVKKPFYCMIAGDYRTSAPIRKFYKSSIPTTTDQNSEHYIPSDNYFSDLNTIWEMSYTPAGIYSANLRSRSFSPSIPVSRLLCHTEAEIINFTEKVILYEKYPGRGDASYLINGLISRHQHGFNKPGLFDNLSGFDVTELNSNCDSIAMENLRPTGVEVINEMNHKGLISFKNHGDPISLEVSRLGTATGKFAYMQGIFVISQLNYQEGTTLFSHDWTGGLDKLINFNEPAIAYSLACTIAPFDNKFTSNNQEHTIVSAFTTAGKYGGPVFLANTRDGYWRESSLLESSFGEQLETSAQSLGILENNSKILSGLSNYFQYVHNVIGDGSIKIWKTIPTIFNPQYRFYNNMIQFSGIDKTEIFHIGIHNREFSFRAIASSKTGELNVPIANLNDDTNSLTTLTIQTGEHFPSTLILTSGLPIKGYEQRIVVNKAHFSKTKAFNSSGIAKIGYMPLDKFASYLNVGTGSKIEIYSFEDIKSEDGILIGENAALKLESGKTVRLEGDVVEKDGTLEIKAESLVLGPGFEIKKGGQFIFTNN